MEVLVIFSSLLWCISKWNSFSNKKKCRAGLDFVHGELFGFLDGCGLVPSSCQLTSSEKRRWKLLWWKITWPH